MIKCTALLLLLIASQAQADPEVPRPMGRLSGSVLLSQHLNPIYGRGVSMGLALELSMSGETFRHSFGGEYRGGDLGQLFVFGDLAYDGGRSKYGFSHGFISAGLGVGSSWGYPEQGTFTTDIRGSVGYSIRSGKRMEVTPAFIYRMSAIDPFGRQEIRHLLGLQIKVSWAYFAKRSDEGADVL